jgi:hypothetical protein
MGQFSYMGAPSALMLGDLSVAEIIGLELGLS